MRFILFIYVCFCILPLSKGQDSERKSYSGNSLSDARDLSTIDATIRNDLPGFLAVFTHRHILDENFDLRFSPDADYNESNISMLHPEKTYTLTFENDKESAPYSAMATLFPATKMGPTAVRKQVCFVEFTELLESYEIVTYAIRHESGAVETSFFWKKLPSEPYQHAHFKWLSSVEVKYDNEQVLISIPDLDEAATAVEIFDQTGQKVTIRSSRSHHSTLIISIDDFDPGTYLIVVKTDLKPVHAAFIKLGAI